MEKNTTDISITEICQNIGGVVGKTITAEVLKLFHNNGLTYKVRDDGSRYRIFCYIKKSKESVILGTMYNRTDFIVQLRISDRTVLNKLDELTENIRNNMLNGPNCKESCFRKCETVYAFSYRDKEYRKCQALICNFIFKNLQNEDIASLIGLIQNEIINYAKRRCISPSTV